MASQCEDNFADLDTEEVDPLTELFNNAANQVKRLVNSLTEKQLLLLYGAYKQATVGACATSRPRWYEMQAKAKWDAWNALGATSQEEAKQSYIKLVQEFDPSWEPSETAAGSADNWAAVSSLIPLDAYLDEDDKTLIDFVKEANLEKVQAMLAIISKNNPNFAEQINDLDEDGLGLIHWAADRGNAEMLECLLDFGADVSCVDSSGQTALHYAASCGHFECSGLLLRKGVDVKIEDEDGCSAADVSTEKRISDLLQGALNDLNSS